ncbi:MAG: HesB/YadR/YfhF family protein [Bacillota bacterium]
MIKIESNAYKWFESEFVVPKPFSIRLYPQYAGFGEKNKGFSLAFSLEEPNIAETQQEIDGITFFIESNDCWFFDDTNVSIQFCENKKEVYTTYS